MGSPWICVSFGKRDFNLSSDVDVLIISDRLPAHPVRRMEVLYTGVEPPLEPKGYTLEEFSRLFQQPRSVLKGMLEPSIVVVDDLLIAGEDENQHQGGNYV